MNHNNHVLIARMLGDDYVAVPPSAERRLEDRLVQHSPWQGEDVELVLFNGHYLAIRDRQRLELEERVVNLAYLYPRPEYQRGDVVTRMSVVGAVGLLMLMLAALLQPQALFMVALAVFSLLLLALMSARPGRWEFHTAVGAIPVCAVNRGLLRSADARRFVELLAQRAEGAQVVLPTGNKRLAAELAEHRRMLESGWLSPRHYASARRRLLQRLRRSADVSKVQLA